MRGKYSSMKDHCITDIYKYREKLLKNLEPMANLDVAEDIVQDLFLRLMTVKILRKLERPYAYLYRSAVNQLMDNDKTRQVRESYQQSVIMEERDHISPERHLLAHEKLQKTMEEIKKMPPKRRQVFLLQKLEGLSCHEISQMIQISTITVRTHMTRAMSQLRLSSPCPPPTVD